MSDMAVVNWIDAGAWVIATLIIADLLPGFLIYGCLIAAFTAGAAWSDAKSGREGSR